MTMFRLRPTSYLLFLALYALLGLAAVAEGSATLALRYQLARKVSAEKKLDEELARSLIVLSNLQNPARLEEIIRRARLPLAPLNQLKITN
ncbi:MAG: hypothetical protein LBP75_00220 [Planctomycetota bacterium]|jgi:hypothetical protein|nr:hypothetical protein [Planctomycetota bacterium]